MTASPRISPPPTTGREWLGRILTKLVRGLHRMDIPLNFGAGNSSDYNYETARLDYQRHLKNLPADCHPDPLRSDLDLEVGSGGVARPMSVAFINQQDSAGND